VEENIIICVWIVKYKLNVYLRLQISPTTLFCGAFELMNTLIVLFNLKKDADSGAYEAWAKATDLPVVRGLSSVDSFEVYRSQGLFGGGEAPYEYVEMIDINDVDQFGTEVGSATMAKVASEFQGFADNPVFILTSKFS